MPLCLGKPEPSADPPHRRGGQKAAHTIRYTFRNSASRPRPFAAAPRSARPGFQSAAGSSRRTLRMTILHIATLPGQAISLPVFLLLPGDGEGPAMGGPNASRTPSHPSRGDCVRQPCCRRLPRSVNNIGAALPFYNGAEMDGNAILEQVKWVR